MPNDRAQKINKLGRSAMIESTDSSRAAMPRTPACPALIQRLRWLANSAALAYISIFALQLHKIWNIWQYRDLTGGDTSSYFVDAYRWFSGFQVNIVWSPLYTAFYGSLLWLSPDAYVVTILHRVLIVLAATVLVLAVMRRLLPPALAWLVAAWWAILPVNFDVMYEVHLFAVLPILLAWLFAFRTNPGTWTRGSVLAIFLLATVLVRNELIIAAAVFAGICAIIEWREFKKRKALRNPIGTASIYLGFVSASLLLIYGCYSISYIKYPELPLLLKDKHVQSMGQAFAYGYQQRHPEWTKSAMTEYADLCQNVFGTTHPTLALMAWRNPAALAQHILWNMSLTPNGLQILLFDSSSGKINPDYSPQKMNRKWPAYYSLAVIGVIACAIPVWWFQRRELRDWFASRSLGWWAMIAVVAVSPAVIITQRPRPEYLYPLGLFIMAVAGTAVWILIRKQRIEMIEWIVTLPLMLFGWLGVSSQYQPGLPGQRPLLDSYMRLLPFTSAIDRSDVVFLKGEDAFETCAYVGHGHGRFYDYGVVFPTWKGEISLADFFAGKNINLVYLNDWAISKIKITAPGALEKFENEGGRQGWHLIGLAEVPQRWMLFEQTGVITAGPTWNAENP